jgi:hypothetical protein
VCPGGRASDGGEGAWLGATLVGVMKQVKKEVPGTLRNEDVGSAQGTNGTDASAAGYAKRMELFSLNKSLPGSAACPSSIAARCDLDRVRNMDEHNQDAPLVCADALRGNPHDRAGFGIPVEK